MRYSVYRQIRFLVVVNQAALLPVFLSIHLVDELHVGERDRQVTEEETFMEDHDQFVR